MKNRLKSSVAAGLFALALLTPTNRCANLTDIAKPYLGIYECTQAQLGEKDLLSQFSDFRLEFKDEETLVLYYQEKSGTRKTLSVQYSYDEERGVLTLAGENSLKREFPFENGRLTVSFPVGGTTALLRFERR